MKKEVIVYTQQSPECQELMDIESKWYDFNSRRFIVEFILTHGSPQKNNLDYFFTEYINAYTIFHKAKADFFQKHIAPIYGSEAKIIFLFGTGTVEVELNDT